MISYQLIKASTSSGANYWLRIIHELEDQGIKIKSLVNESEELKKILGSISSKISPNN